MKGSWASAVTEPGGAPWLPWHCAALPTMAWASESPPRESPTQRVPLRSLISTLGGSALPDLL